jgi:uncharacterized protein YbjT (DUF2867 family)
MSRRALVLGATGLVGRYCLDELLRCEEYGRVRVLSRRDIDVTHEKLEVHLSSLDDMTADIAAFDVDDVFCCLGSTLKKAGSRAAFYHVDHDLCVLAANLAAKQGARHFSMVSAVNAREQSAVFYSRTKGEAERDVLAAGIPSVMIFQPSFLLGHRDEYRMGEWLGIQCMRTLRPFLHRTKSDLTPVSAPLLARAMVASALHGPEQGACRYRYRDFLYWSSRLNG